MCYRVLVRTGGDAWGGTVGTIAVDIVRAERYGLADAKAHLSDLVATVEQTGEACVIMRYGRPAACIAPLPVEGAPSTKRAKGMLAAYAGAEKRAQEAGAFERAMVHKHDNAA